MAQFQINKEKIYEDVIIQGFELTINGETIKADTTHHKELLKASEDIKLTDTSVVDKKDSVFITEGCTLNFEVITPRPEISIDIAVCNDEEYKFWDFSSTNQVEKFIEENSLVFA